MLLSLQTNRNFPTSGAEFELAKAVKFSVQLSLICVSFSKRGRLEIINSLLTFVEQAPHSRLFVPNSLGNDSAVPLTKNIGVP